MKFHLKLASDTETMQDWLKVQLEIFDFHSISKFVDRFTKYTPKLRDFSPQANYTTERPPLLGEVSANFCE
jgi:hypothetical protein